MLIEFSKAWGQNEHRWNYCGGNWNFGSMIGFMEYYGIRKAWIVDQEYYFEDDKDVETECNVYRGFPTKHLEEVEKHWATDYCTPCKGINLINII